MRSLVRLSDMFLPIFILRYSCFRYFVAQDSEKRVHLYKSSTHLSSAPHIPECITCKLPRDCDVSRVHMSPENSFFIQESESNIQSNITKNTRQRWKWDCWEWLSSTKLGLLFII